MSRKWWDAGSQQHSLSKPQIKAAYLHNFARFVEWPETYTGATMRFCVGQ